MRPFKQVLLSRLLVCISLLLTLLWSVNAQDGWKMIDRFYGFRYEMHGDGSYNKSTMEGIQQYAHSLGCFGWVQLSKSLSIVGEGRCSKGKGKVFQEWLEKSTGGRKFESLVGHVNVLTISFINR
jgi:hypothetical protein